MADVALERRIVDLPRGGGRRYCVVGSRMAVDFHVTHITGHDPIAGLEMHYRQRPSYLDDQAAHFDKCWLTDAPCWCDGTSLYATEYLLPLLAEGGIEDFWPVLEAELRRRDRDAFGED